MIDYTKPLLTASGRPARLLCTDAKGMFPVRAYITIDGHEFIGHYRMDGTQGERSNGWELVNAD